MDTKDLKNGKHIIRMTNGRVRVLTVNNNPSLTDQQWKEDCDTNTIIKKFKQTGQISHLAQRQGSFADVSQIPDLLPSLLKMKEAKDLFYTLPSSTRTKFDNSIEKLVSFLQDNSNTNEAISMGLISKPPGWVAPKPPAEPSAPTAPATAPAIKEETKTT